MFYIRNIETREYAHKDSQGQRDGKTTFNIKDAARFADSADAYIYVQKFNADWAIV